MNIFPSNTIYQLSDDIRKTNGLYIVKTPMPDNEGDESWDLIHLTKNSIKVSEIKYQIVGRFWDLDFATLSHQAVEKSMNGGE